MTALVSGLIIGQLGRPQLVYAASSDQQISLAQIAAGQSRTEPEQSPALKNEHNERVTEKKSPKTLLEAITGKGGKDEKSTDQRLDPDRPHLPEASTSVGKGHILLEGGYTFNQGKRSSFSSHGYPEALLRIGMFTDWFEFRVGENFLKQKHTISGVTSKASGAQDLYLGVKLAATQQKRYLPEIALIPQMTVPTGSSSVTGGRVLPGVNVDGTWEMNKRFGAEVVVGANRVADDAQHSHVELAVGLTPVFQLSRRLEAFAEWDAFYLRGGIDPATGPRHYGVGGLVLFVTKDFALDFRAGAGLNAQANRFLIGTGFAFRY